MVSIQATVAVWVFSLIFFLVSCDGSLDAVCGNKIVQIVMEVGVPIFRIFKRTRGFMCSVSMGKETEMVVVVEELLKVDVAKEFLKSYKVGSKAFII